MERHADAGPMNSAPTRLQGEQAMQQVRVLFQRTLAKWASDCLELRRQDLAAMQWSAEMGVYPDLRDAA